MDEKYTCTECGAEIDHQGGISSRCWDKKSDEANNIYVQKVDIGSEDN
jgi:DNA-directed RNA polymerase subunit RPC12/RpoP